MERVERAINIYDKDNELIREIDIDVPIDKLKEIVSPKSDDPELYLDYRLDSKQLDRINTYLRERVSPEFERFSYYLVAAGIYNW